MTSGKRAREKAILGSLRRWSLDADPNIDLLRICTRCCDSRENGNFTLGKMLRSANQETQPKQVNLSSFSVQRPCLAMKILPTHPTQICDYRERTLRSPGKKESV